MIIREYRKTDFEACLLIFASNTPKHFVPAERNDLVANLQHCQGPYFIAQMYNYVVGGGGYLYDGNAAHLWWDMVHKDLQGQGVGRALIEHRLQELDLNYPNIPVFAATCETAQPFYEKMGFEVYAIEEQNKNLRSRKLLMKHVKNPRRACDESTGGL